jgi:hypothetical protein
VEPRQIAVCVGSLGLSGTGVTVISTRRPSDVFAAGELVSVRPTSFDAQAKHIRVKRTGNDVLMRYVFVRTSLAGLRLGSRISDRKCSPADVVVRYRERPPNEGDPHSNEGEPYLPMAVSVTVRRERFLEVREFTNRSAPGNNRPELRLMMNDEPRHQEQQGQTHHNDQEPHFARPVVAEP